MSNADEVTLGYVEETTFGTTPASPTLIDLRFESEDLKAESDFIESKELDATRNVKDLIRVGHRVTGTIDGELSYGAYDDFLEAALMSSGWVAQDSNSGTTLSCAASTQRISDSGNGFTGFDQYSWVKVSGFTESANNGYFKIADVDGSGGWIELEKGLTSLVDESAGDSVTVIQGAYITNGTTFRSFAIEREYTDLSNEFVMFNGVSMRGFSMEVNAKGIIDIKFNCLGKTETSATATAASGTTAAPTNDVMNGIDDLLELLEAGSDTGVLSWNLALDNNQDERLQCGTLGPVSIKSGKCRATGGINLYYTAKALADKFLNVTASSMTVVVEKDSDAYIIELPRTKYSTAPRGASGTNEDVKLPLNYTAIEDPDEAITIRICKFPSS